MIVMGGFMLSIAVVNYFALHTAMRALGVFLKAVFSRLIWGI